MKMNISIPRTISLHRVFTIREMYSIFIALIPVLQIYHFPFVTMGMSTILMGLTCPYPFFCIISRRNIRPLLPSLFFFVYIIIRSYPDIENIFLYSLSLIHVLGAFNDSLDIGLIRNTIETVSLLTVPCVILQTLLHYLLGINLNLLISALLVKGGVEANAMLNMGSYLFRPSAFFLEPSHLAQYCTVALASVLFPKNNEPARVDKAAWIVLSCVLSTSGMGIGLCLGVIGVYALFGRHNSSITNRLRSIITVGLLICVVFLILSRFEFFNKALQRILPKNGQNSTQAILGRTMYWDTYIGTMEKKDLIWGYGMYAPEPQYYMTGLMTLIYRYGYISVVLIGIVLLISALSAHNPFVFTQCALYAALIPFSGAIGFMGIAFRLCLIGSSQINERHPLTNQILGG